MSPGSYPYPFLCVNKIPFASTSCSLWFIHCNNIPIVADCSARRALLLVPPKGVDEAQPAERVAAAEADRLDHERQAHGAL